MKATTISKISACLAGVATLIWGGCGTPGPSVPNRAVEDQQVEAIYGRAAPGYVRQPAPSAGLREESYELRPGGDLEGKASGDTIDGLSYEDIARVIAEPLAIGNFRQSQDPGATRLLIKVYWGDTRVPYELRPIENRQSTYLSAEARDESDDAKKQSLLWQAKVMRQIEAAEDEKTNSANATLLGFASELDRQDQADPGRRRLVRELGMSRFCVVLLAYDFQEIKRTGKERLLWETRFSIQRQGNDLERAFPLMAYSAASFFGTSTPVVVHRVMGGVLPVPAIEASPP